jgi:hypothetical protein
VVIWVSPNTNTRSKNSSRGVTLASVVAATIRGVRTAKILTCSQRNRPGQ